VGRLDALKALIVLVRKLNDAHVGVYDVITNFPFYREHLDQIIAELGPGLVALPVDFPNSKCVV